MTTGGFTGGDMAVTEMAVISFAHGHPALLEAAPGVSVQDVLAATKAALAVPDHVPTMNIEGVPS